MQTSDILSRILNYCIVEALSFYEITYDAKTDNNCAVEAGNARYRLRYRVKGTPPVFTCQLSVVLADTDLVNWIPVFLASSCTPASIDAAINDIRAFIKTNLRD